MKIALKKNLYLGLNIAVLRYFWCLNHTVFLLQKKKIYKKYIILSAFFSLLHPHSYDVCRRRCIWAFAWFVGSDVVTQLCQISWRFSTFAKFFAFALIWSTLSSKIIRVRSNMFPISFGIFKKDNKFLQEMSAMKYLNELSVAMRILLCTLIYYLFTLD